MTKRANVLLSLVVFGVLVLAMRTAIVRAEGETERKLTLLCGDEATWIPSESHKDVLVKTNGSHCEVKFEPKCSDGAQPTPASISLKPENSKRFTCPAGKHITEVKVTCTTSTADKNCVVELTPEK